MGLGLREAKRKNIPDSKDTRGEDFWQEGLRRSITTLLKKQL